MRRDTVPLPQTSTVGSPATVSPRAGTIERRLAVILAVGAFSLPLVFTTAIDDVFALPKTVAMVGLSIPMLGGLVALAARSHIARGQPSGVLLALGAYVVLTTAATLRSPDPTQSLVGERLQYQGLLAAGGYAVAFLAARSSLGSPVWLRRLVAPALTAAVLVSAYGLLQELDADPIWDVLNKGRVFSTLGQANALAAYLVIILPLALALAVLGAGIGRAVAILAAALIGITLALTLSRGGYLGALAASGVFAACVVRWSSLTRRRLAMGVGLVVAVLAIVAFVPPVSRTAERVVDRALQTADLSESSTASHLDLWTVGVRMAVDYPILGIGPEIYPQLFPRYRDDVLSPARAAVMARFRPESPHNVPIAIAVGAGLPALLAYLAIVGLCVRAGWRRLTGAPPIERPLVAALLAGVAGHVVTDLFMTAEATGSWIFWVVLGALCARAHGVSTHRPLPRPDGVIPPAGSAAGDGSGQSALAAWCRTVRTCRTGSRL